MREENLFKSFCDNRCSNLKLYNEVKEILVKHEQEIKARENAKFYDHLRVLCDSENNAGWEERHSDRIRFINNIMSEIIDDYEEYLP